MRFACRTTQSRIERPPERGDYNSSLALSTLLDTAVAVALAASFTFFGSGRKLPSFKLEKAKSKRAPRYHAVPTYRLMSVIATQHFGGYSIP